MPSFCRAASRVRGASSHLRCATDNHYEFAQCLDLRAYFGETSEYEFLVKLRDFAPDTGFPIAQNLQHVRQHFLDPVRRLIKDQSTSDIHDRCEPLSARSLLRG